MSVKLDVVQELGILTGVDARRSDVRVVDCKCVLAGWIRCCEGAQSSGNGEQRENGRHGFDCLEVADVTGD